MASADGKSKGLLYVLLHCALGPTASFSWTRKIVDQSREKKKRGQKNVVDEDVEGRERRIGVGVVRRRVLDEEEMSLFERQRKGEKQKGMSTGSECISTGSQGAAIQLQKAIGEEEEEKEQEEKEEERQKEEGEGGRERKREEEEKSQEKREGDIEERSEEKDSEGGGGMLDSRFKDDDNESDNYGYDAGDGDEDELDEHDALDRRAEDGDLSRESKLAETEQLHSFDHPLGKETTTFSDASRRMEGKSSRPLSFCSDMRLHRLHGSAASAVPTITASSSSPSLAGNKKASTSRSPQSSSPSLSSSSLSFSSSSRIVVPRFALSQDINPSTPLQNQDDEQDSLMEAETEEERVGREIYQKGEDEGGCGYLVMLLMKQFSAMKVVDLSGYRDGDAGKP